MATKKAAKAGQKRRGLSAKNEAERERLETLIETNEERLAGNRAVNGAPLTPEQQDALREVLKLQREKLEQIRVLQ